MFTPVWAQLGLNQRPPDYESGATNQLSYRPGKPRQKFKNLPNIFHQTFISTSTPLGSSSFIRASTVLGVEL